MIYDCTRDLFRHAFERWFKFEIFISKVELIAKSREVYLTSFLKVTSNVGHYVMFLWEIITATVDSYEGSEQVSRQRRILIVINALQAVTSLEIGRSVWKTVLYQKK